MKHDRTQGFTLIEAAVAIAVVAILSGIIVPLVVKNLNDARVARARNDLQVISAAVASQLKDTGTRPNNGAGAGSVAWGSGQTPATTAPTNATVVNANNFRSLFSAPVPGVTLANAQGIFGFPTGTTVNSEFAYKGPYLAPDIADKTDPWGRSYLVLGYNATGRTGSTPIYVVSAGPDGQVTTVNFNGGMGPAGAGIWGVGGVSADDLVVRVN